MKFLPFITIGIGIVIVVMFFAFSGSFEEKQVLTFKPVGEGTVVCRSLDCPLLYEKEGCGQGFFVKEDGELLKQKNSGIIEDPKIMLYFSQCN